MQMKRGKAIIANNWNSVTELAVSNGERVSWPFEVSGICMANMAMCCCYAISDLCEILLLFKFQINTSKQ